MVRIARAVVDVEALGHVLLNAVVLAGPPELGNDWRNTVENTREGGEQRNPYVDGYGDTGQIYGAGLSAKNAA